MTNCQRPGCHHPGFQHSSGFSCSINGCDCRGFQIYVEEENQTTSRVVIQTVHIWGFFDDEGHHRLPDGCAVSTQRPYEVWVRVCSNIRGSRKDFAENVFNNISVTRTLDGDFIGIEFETSAGPADMPARMWHVIKKSSNDWPVIDSIDYGRLLVKEKVSV